jgi:hypothetical protein
MLCIPSRNSANKTMGCITAFSAKGNNYAIALLAVIAKVMRGKNAVSWAKISY